MLLIRHGSSDPVFSPGLLENESDMVGCKDFFILRLIHMLFSSGSAGR